MARLLIVGVIVAVAFTLFALVDAAMTDQSRARGVSKPVWIVLIVILPVVGGLLWLLIGKGDPAQVPVRHTPPDDDPRFGAPRMSSEELDAHMRDLEARLQELDDEVFPGESSPEPPQEHTQEHPQEQSGEQPDEPTDPAGEGQDKSL